jgi:predicted DNA-binding mobile mystery protein A
MSYWDKKLIRDQLDKRLDSLVPLADSPIPGTGWIKTLREALGMSAKQLGKRVGIDQSRISRLEKAEADGDLKLSSLKKVAEGLDMKFVYSFVPKERLETMVRDQAKKIALERMAKVNHTMRLEEQELSDEQKEQALEDLIQKILLEEPKDFWDQ